jgi:Fur family ferric uptake transcriptional regulator
MTVRRDRLALKEVLRDAGLRATGPRLAVLAVLRASPKPLSHGEVVDALERDDWDRATVYRNLVKLSEVGLAHVASHAGGVARYEARRADGHDRLHAHFSCVSCGRVTCLEGAELSPPRDRAWRLALEDAEVQVVGRCPACRSTP